MEEQQRNKQNRNRTLPVNMEKQTKCLKEKTDKLANNTTKKQKQSRKQTNKLKYPYQER